MNVSNNQRLCEQLMDEYTIRMKIHVTCTFILLKINSFSCKVFCMSIRSKKRPRQKGWQLFRFLWQN